MSDTNRNAQKWALLVGADFYMKGEARRDGSGRVVHYPSLGGCVNDVTLVECFLKDDVGVPSDHITKLTSSRADGSKQDVPQEPPSAWPTYINIARAFEDILKRSHKGDSVYIHFSGHGARVRTVYEKLKGQDGLDEALVPVDIEVLSTNGQGRYIRDVEMADWLQRFVDKGLRLAVVLDSCHAGSAHRAVSHNVRGTGDIDNCVLLSDRPQDPLQSRLHRPDVTRRATMEKSWILEASGYTLFAACTAFQKAHEHRFAEKKHGAFTYYLVGALRSEGFIKPSLLLRRVSVKVQSHFSDQTPIVDGEDDAALFDIARPRRDPDIQILTVNTAYQLVEIDHGDLHGVNKGAVYGIFAEGEGSPEKGMVAKARVTRVQGLKCFAKLFDTTGPIQDIIKAGCRAVMLTQAPEKLADIALVTCDTAPNADKQTEWLNAFRAYADKRESRSGLWRLLPDGVMDSATFFVAITDNGHYEVWDAAQVPLPNLPEIQAETTGATEALSICITHLVKFRLIQRLGAERSSTLDTPSRFEIMGKSAVPPQAINPKFTTDLEFPNGLEPAMLEKGAFTVTHGEITNILLQNNGDSTIYFALFDIQPTWGIAKVYPAGSGLSEPVGPGEKRSLPILMKIPDCILDRGGRVITETLKAVVTVHQTPLDVLELPDIEEDVMRGSNDPDFRSALDELMDALSPYRHAFGREPFRRTTGSWEARNIVVRTVVSAAQ